MKIQTVLKDSRGGEKSSLTLLDPWLGLKTNPTKPAQREESAQRRSAPALPAAGLPKEMKTQSQTYFTPSDEEQAVVGNTTGWEV